VAVVGASLNLSCGVRDHATLLADGLSAAGVPCELRWLAREDVSLRGSRAEIGNWAQALSASLTAAPPPAILLHYSVFTLSHKGLPVFVPSVLAALRRSGAPVVTVMHEFAYPWLYGGWRGAVWAITQRAALVDVVRSSSALMATSGPRAVWLRERRWLPRRPVLAAPVFSNLPPPGPRTARQGGEPPIGLFGYSYQGAAAALILDALAAVRDGEVQPAVRMLGAPGPDSPAGREWIALAGARGLTLQFSGRLPAQELSDALAACDLLIFGDSAGPSPRKGTLAAALASGRPVVAIDGPDTWRELREERAAAVAEPSAEALAATVRTLLRDREALERLGDRGRAFYAREMALERSVDVARTLIAQVSGGRPPLRALDARAPAG
jgi:glycosyltransferase involved in cell wall biosynthesis